MTPPDDAAWAVAEVALELPPGTPILTANHRLHRLAANNRTQQLKAVVWQLARHARLPVLGPCDVTVEYESPPRRRKDRHPLSSDRVEDSDAIAPTAKACVDALADFGTFGGADSKTRVRKVAYQLLPETHPRGLVRIRLAPITPEVSDGACRTGDDALSPPTPAAG